MTTIYCVGQSAALGRVEGKAGEHYSIASFLKALQYSRNGSVMCCELSLARRI